MSAAQRLSNLTLISLLYQTCMVLMGNALARRLKSITAARKIASRNCNHRIWH
jgi:hypothetical protein